MKRVVQAFAWFFSILLGSGLRRITEWESGVRVETAPPQEPPSKKTNPEALESAKREGAARMIGILQEEARLVDFLMEDISAYGDAQVGAAVREVQSKASHVLRELCSLVPVREEEEGASIAVNSKDASAVRLVGNVSSNETQYGVLRHHGWRMNHLPAIATEMANDPLMVALAEVEVE